jgi:hypothetical protein
MGYTQVALEEKIYELYPELQRYNIKLSLEFDEQKDAWIIKFEKDGLKRYAILDKKDADACMDGYVCIYLGVLLDQYINELKKTGK